ncbi:acetyl-CoA C-acyltransferase [Pleionea sp. CnH1-48]|uniref:acetyl-CoA C-acyltransferase n=1 Tax=Pleionea sp. CnH1-48 TaxID=2954494 RepID=UPI00209720A6|nr:acetyl-CoA C-acyltransferase [Pleionea sp. CnH1-48]MCO7226848.1 acetyl-CoA C-acyltransferase [Pleionea sp. CnH1-48]
MSNNDPIVIVGQARTPMGGFMGALSSVKTPELGASAIKAAVERAGLKGEDVQEVIMGCVLPAALGQAPARQASIGAGIPKSAGCTTINKVCGSGMKTIMLAHDLLMAGTNEVMVAGGMESMSNAPHMLDNARSGYRFGHGKLIDHMAFDGLEDAYEGQAMGVYAEDCVSKYDFTREEQDEFAITSLKRAQKAIEEGAFKDEITPFTIASRKGETVVDTDEQPLKARLDKIPQLRPAFKKDGSVTAANASSISDGAAAVVLMRQSEAEKRGLKPLAKIVGHATHAQEPAEFTTAPVGAMKSLFEKTGWTQNDVDLFEINEAFAVVTMAAMKELELDHDKVNVHGGACALGHPIGCSGTRIVVTLIEALRRYEKKRGVASLCIGGGEATALAIELV